MLMLILGGIYAIGLVLTTVICLGLTLWVLVRIVIDWLVQHDRPVDDLIPHVGFIFRKEEKPAPTP